MEETNYSQSVAGIAMEDGKVLLARHTYGGGAGKYIIPGGYLNHGESPQEGIIREFMEETGLRVRPEALVGIRFNMKDWYVVFLVKVLDGKLIPDMKEIDDLRYFPVEEALTRADVPDLTKALIRSALAGKGFEALPYESVSSKTPYSLYGMKEEAWHD